MEKLDEFVTDLNARHGTSAVMPRLQDGGPKIDFAGLDAQLQSAIVGIVKDSLIFDWVPHYRDAYKDYL